MPRMLALDWTRHEARYVLANSSGDQLTINAAGAISLSDLSDEDFADPEKLGEALRSGLSSVKIGRCTTFIGIDRSSVELLEFTVPKVPEAELPQLVLNLAMRESPTVAEESTVDFSTAHSAGDDSLDVTAVAVSAGEMKRLQQTCEAAKLAPQRFLLRSFATAALLPANSTPTPPRCLLVNRIGEDADLTVVDSGHVIFSRTVRLPGEDRNHATTQRLVQEIRRTMMVAPHGKNGNRVEAVYILGREEEHTELLAAAGEEFAAEDPNQLDDHTAGVRVGMFDVFGALAADRDLIPADSGRYASLLGMLRTEAGEEPHTFDFMNPRKPPPAPDHRRRLAFFGGMAVAAALIMVYPTYSDYSQLVDKNDELASRLKDKKKSAKKIKEQAEIAAAISAWEAKSVNWLDELQSFSERFPSARDAMVLRMTLSPSRGSRGSIAFNGLARDPAIVTQMELSLRDAAHEIQTSRVQEREQEKGYTWQFDSRMELLKPEADSKEKPKKKSSGNKSAENEEEADETDATKSADTPKTQPSDNKQSSPVTAEAKSKDGAGQKGAETANDGQKPAGEGK